MFAGLARDETPFPIAYPTAARPQAWAAGAPVLLLRSCSAPPRQAPAARLETVAPPDVAGLAGTIKLSGVRAFDRHLERPAGRRRVEVEEA